jgi:hypothetical protein
MMKISIIRIHFQSKKNKMTLAIQIVKSLDLEKGILMKIHK